MAKKTLPIGTYQYANEQASSRKLVNCTAEQATPDSGNLIVLRRMPGVDDFATTAAGVRGAHVFNGDLYVVAGTSLFKITTAGVTSTIGSIPGSGLVSMSANTSTLVIVTNPAAWSSDGSTVSQITDSVFLGFGGASDVDFLDGFLIFTVPDSQVSFVSGLEALTFDALDFTSVDGSTGKLLGLIVDHREIIFLKEATTEIFYNAANPVGYPFSRSPSGYLEIGCVSAQTAAKLGGAVYWLANDNTVRQLSGATPSIISTVGISKFIESASSAYGFAYTFEDKHYYVLALPDVTLEYDIVAGEWHNRSTFGEAIWQVQAVLEAFGTRVAVNSIDGKVGKLNTATRTEWGGIQKTEWTYQEIDGDGRRLLHDRFQIKLGTGVGLNTGQGSDPLIELEISDDGGKQFRSFDTRSLGQIGEYGNRVVWHRLGSAYNRVYRCGMTDPVDLIAFDTEVEVRSARF